MDKNKYDHIRLWIEDVETYNIHDNTKHHYFCPIIIVGTKKILRGSDSDMTVERGQSLATELESELKIPVSYKECSAKTGEGIEDLLKEIDRLTLVSQNQSAQAKNNTAQNNKEEEKSSHGFKR